MPETIEVVNNPERHRFETRLNGVLAMASYRLAGDVITFTHTEVPDTISGHGVANKLARTALDHARENGLTVVPLCPFIAAYIKRHPEYQSLVKV